MQNAILSAKTLIEKKNLIEKRKNKNIVIDVDGLGAFKFRVPDVCDLADMKAYSKNKDADKEDQYLIYSCCLEPNLKDQELQAAFGAGIVDIVDKIFLPGQVYNVALELVKAAGFAEQTAKVVEEIKNEQEEIVNYD